MYEEGRLLSQKASWINGAAAAERAFALRLDRQVGRIGMVRTDPGCLERDGATVHAARFVAGDGWRLFGGPNAHPGDASRIDVEI